MTAAPEVGRRVKACDRYPKSLRGKLGTIRSVPDWRHWAVQWDGEKDVGPVHREFVELLPAKDVKEAKPTKEQRKQGKRK